MTLQECLEVLGIEKYSKRIFNSNSHGELFHLHQYFVLAETVGKTDWFPVFFDKMVEMVEKTWQRPESVFQHVQKILSENINQVKE